MKADPKYHTRLQTTIVDPHPHSYARSEPHKPVKTKKQPVQKEEQIASFWLFYLILFIGSIIPIVGVFPAFILFSFTKNKFFRMLPLVVSLCTSGYALYLRAHSGSVFQELKHLVY
ncbi:hypothetical protein ACE5IS_07825 [Leptospira wolffii]|uniref:Uncharacterized protein n=1 Tax=Leptospira wolffii TaxID=409998 RepID=A0ABV5BPN0_9LEPT|nr:hypothetical protein [Leptospira wolffii]EPG67181.1 hypothetical protein LEP1GSC061_1646 [Leptospira wolffii serovar Khorat str. Khorat-H2]